MCNLKLVDTKKKAYRHYIYTRCQDIYIHTAKSIYTHVATTCIYLSHMHIDITTSHHVSLIYLISRQFHIHGISTYLLIHDLHILIITLCRIANTVCLLSMTERLSHSAATKQNEERTK